MKQLKTIVKKKEEERYGRKRKNKEKKREKREEGKVLSHSQEIQMNLKIVFLFSQDSNLFHCPFYPIFTVIDTETRPLVQFHRMSELERTVEMISNLLVLWINKLRPAEGNDFNKVSS